MNDIISLENIDEKEAIKAIKESLKIKGNFILLPTETVYGLACLFDDEIAKKNIYKSKKRAENKPFQILISSIEMLKKTDAIINTTTEKLIKNFCPGGITIIVPTNSSDTVKVGFRIPDHKFVLGLLGKLGKPLSATSANIAGDPPALNINQALGTLNKRPNLIIDGGQINKDSKASTVVEVIGNSVKILRKGPISLEEIEKKIEE